MQSHSCTDGSGPDHRGHCARYSELEVLESPCSALNGSSQSVGLASNSPQLKRNLENGIVVLRAFRTSPENMARHWVSCCSLLIDLNFGFGIETATSMISSPCVLHKYSIPESPDHFFNAGHFFTPS
mmetsp:Transcript_33574/g.88988  ORF Transcript_33574/g.88988 Transcript_33574/m.88988 type:complete len:127 (+) Transcript_33574:128-508(+)